MYLFAKLPELAVTRHASRFSAGCEERSAEQWTLTIPTSGLRATRAHNSFVILVVIIMVVVDVLKCREIKNSM